MREAFSQSYFAAREKFLRIAQEVGAAVKSYANPAPGPGGAQLTCDVARLGKADARRWLIAVSATHGAEGFVGSAAQIAWMRQRHQLPDGVGVLLVHAINPYGFAWLRRVNEDNVDINRNHIDHDKPHPANPVYVELADLLVPKDWFGPGRAASEAALGDYMAHHGAGALAAAISGQYEVADGIFYGGRRPVWSNRTLQAAAAEFAGSAELVAYVDFHTGLGPYGIGEAICYHAPGDPAYAFALAAYGAGITTPHLGTSSSPMNKGKTGYGVQMALPHSVVSCITLEFGTYDHDFVFGSIRADAWLAKYGRWDWPEAALIKADIRRAFYPDQDDWRDMVSARSAEILGQALRQLGA